MPFTADETVPYGRIVEVLNVGAANDLKMVLATKPVKTPAGSPQPAELPAEATPAPMQPAAVENK